MCAHKIVMQKKFLMLRKLLTVQHVVTIYIREGYTSTKVDVLMYSLTKLSSSNTLDFATKSAGHCKAE